jgi:hypothetical protein
VTFRFGSQLVGLEALMTMQATIERDMSVRDTHGSKSRADWQPISTVPSVTGIGAPVACFLWWGTGPMIARAGKVLQQPEQTVDLLVGGMVMPAGTDVTPLDRIAQVVDANGNEVAGRLKILVVAGFIQVTEIGFRRLT